MELWAECLQCMCQGTGDILISRTALAAAANTSPDEVSRVMSELESIGAIRRHREKIPGLRGPGRARYQVNLNVSTRIPSRAGRPSSP
ncbi:MULTISPECIES: helix-turn-helix domain-containing protein [Acetobacterales]